VLIVSTATCSITAGGDVIEHRRNISSSISHAQPLLAAAAPPNFEAAIAAIAAWFGPNMCLTLRQDVGATTGAATLRFSVLKAEPCHEVIGGDGVAVEGGESEAACGGNLLCWW